MVYCILIVQWVLKVIQLKLVRSFSLVIVLIVTKKPLFATDKTIQTKRLHFFWKTLEETSLKQIKNGRKQNEKFVKSVEDWCKNWCCCSEQKT